MLDTTADAEVTALLDTFGRALETGDIPAALACFQDDCYWRDLVSFTWNIHTSEGKAAIAQLALQQVDRLAAPAEAAEHPHRLVAVPFGQHRAQGRNDRRGGMAPEGGGADQQGIAGADRGDQLVAGGELAVEALHPHAAAGHPLGQGIGDGGGVAVGAGIQQRDGEA